MATFGSVRYIEIMRRVLVFAAVAMVGCVPPVDDEPVPTDAEADGGSDGGGGCITTDGGAGDPSGHGDDAVAGDPTGDSEGDPGGDPCSGDPAPCPDDMVPMGWVCVDRYEASRLDASETSMGVDTSMAVSQPDVLPWYVTQMNTLVLDQFEAACAAAGKRLCRPNEWLEACNGPDNSRYVFGDTWNRETCNCVETLCDDYCVDNSIDMGDCNLGANCGGNCGRLSEQPTGVYCFDVLPTGSFPDCTNAYGTFDVNGNVWEVVPSSLDPRGFEVRGGACNCYAPSVRLECTFNASWTALYAGFRCCLPRW